MFIQLLLGAFIITLTIIVQVIILSVLDRFYVHVRNHFVKGRGAVKKIVVVTTSVLWLVLGITINTWIWAFAFLFTGELKGLEESLYFAIASFTTLGYGDVLLSQDWRIFGALSAVNGLIVFGLNAAFLVELMMSVWGRSRTK